jgi:hypothetical protein
MIDSDDDSKLDSSAATPTIPLTPDSDANCSVMSHALWHSMHSMVEAIVQSNYFNSMVDGLLSGIRTHTGEASASSTENNNREASGSTSLNDSGSLGNRKRQTRGSGPNPPDGGDDGDDSDDSDQGRDKGAKKRRCVPPNRRRQRGEFACPFLKYDRGYFQKDKSCGNASWTDTARVK